MAEVKDVRTGLVTTRYYYDADGKRRVKERLSPAGIVTGVSYAFYEGEYLVCERDTGELIQPEESYARKFLLTDHLGTTRAEMTFDAAGNPVITRTHDTMPYGEVINPDPQSSESVLFTGKERDQESNLDFFGARFYSKTFGRWSSPDKMIFGKQSVANPQQWNIYSYSNNSPIVFCDPNGNDAWIYLVNTAGLNQQYRRDIGIQIAKNLSSYGIKNVRVCWTDNPKTGSHMVTGEIYNKGQSTRFMSVAGDNWGQHAKTESLFAVVAGGGVLEMLDSEINNQDLSKNVLLPRALGNCITHEIIHELNIISKFLCFITLGFGYGGPDHDSDKNSIFWGEGQNFFRNDLVISQAAAIALCLHFNGIFEEDNGWTVYGDSNQYIATSTYAVSPKWRGFSFLGWGFSKNKAGK